jgi:hypothetical protein
MLLPPAAIACSPSRAADGTSLIAFPADQVFPLSTERQAIRSPSAPRPFSPTTAEMIVACGVIAILGPLLMPSESFPCEETTTDLLQLLPPSFDSAKRTLSPAP